MFYSAHQHFNHLYFHLVNNLTYIILLTLTISDQVCKKCGRDWGSPALDCFRKEHELVDINQPPAAAAASAERTNDSAESATPRETEADPLMLQQSSDSSYYGHEKSKYRSNFLPNITYHII